MTRLTSLLLAVVIMVLTSIIVVVMLLVPNVQATKPTYNAPCNAGDWGYRGQCCPADTNHIAHNICYTEKEYQRKQETNKIIGCMAGNAITRNLFGGLNCLMK